MSDCCQYSWIGPSAAPHCTSTTTGPPTLTNSNRSCDQEKQLSVNVPFKCKESFCLPQLVFLLWAPVHQSQQCSGEKKSPAEKGQERGQRAKARNYKRFEVLLSKWASCLKPKREVWREKSLRSLLSFTELCRARRMLGQCCNIIHTSEVICAEAKQSLMLGFFFLLWALWYLHSVSVGNGRVVCLKKSKSRHHLFAWLTVPLLLFLNVKRFILLDTRICVPTHIFKLLHMEKIHKHTLCRICFESCCEYKYWATCKKTNTQLMWWLLKDYSTVVIIILIYQTGLSSDIHVEQVGLVSLWFTGVATFFSSWKIIVRTKLGN